MPSHARCGNPIYKLNMLRRSNHHVAGILNALEVDIRQGVMSPVEAATKLTDTVYKVAMEIFGTFNPDKERLPSGRIPNRWFRHCKHEYQAVKQALQGGDELQIKECRREFKRVQRKWKRHYEAAAQEHMWQSIRFNPRRFWKLYQGRKSTPLGIELDDLQAFWSELYGGQDRGALPEMAPSAQALVESLLDVAQASAGFSHAEQLNDPIQEEEVCEALKKLHLGRAPGPDGLRAEFLKCAYVLEDLGEGKTCKQNLLLPVLHALFEALFRKGDYVREWSSATLSAVFKKGDPTSLDNYRAIAVGAVLGKLYAELLDTSLTVCAEKHGWRAEGQAGFRPNKSTVDQVFILRHLIESTHLSSDPGQELFCCFVDFKKAHDTVQRYLLMKRLSELGLHGSMLMAIAQMYWSVPLVPKQGPDIGSSIDSTCGVKQGDPLSPLLFGLFIDELEEWIKEHATHPDAGARLGASLVHMLLYADDLVLMARTKEGLQSQLDALSTFCSQKHMEVNVGKTEIVVFRPPNKPAQPDWQWSYNGHQVKVSAEFKYLGIVFHETAGVKVAIETLAAAARRAMWAMLGRFRVARIGDIAMKLRLYRALVSPILEYCAGVWGPELLRGCNTPTKVFANELQKVQNTFLRQLGRLRKTVSTIVLHRELCMEPVATAWIRASTQLWRRLYVASVLATPTGTRSLLGRAAVECVRLAATVCNRRKHNWASNFLGMIRSIKEGGGDPSRGSARQLDAFLSCSGWSGPARPGAFWRDEKLVYLYAASLWEEWRALLRTPWEDLPADPRGAGSESVRYATYNSWFAVNDRVDEPEVDDRGIQFPVGMPKYVRHTAGIPYEWVVQLMRFRTGGHHLAVECGRWTNPPTPRLQRLCMFCPQQVVEDEMHVLFDCTAYDAIRQRYAQDLFQELGGIDETRSAVAEDGQFWRFMEQHPRKVARFVYDCLELRRQAGVASPQGSIDEETSQLVSTDDDVV